MDKAKLNSETFVRKYRLLFICLGNICRSPAAEGVMRHIIHENGRDSDFFVDSAGIGDWHAGQLPDSRMRQCGARRGYKFNSRARQIKESDFENFDMLLVMDSDNYRAVTSAAPSAEAAGKVRMLTDFLPGNNGVQAVPDPYYGGMDGFDYALDLIEEACMHLMDVIGGARQ